MKFRAREEEWHCDHAVTSSRTGAGYCMSLTRAVYVSAETAAALFWGWGGEETPGNRQAAQRQEARARHRRLLSDRFSENAPE